LLRVAIIGAGASGLMAAQAAARAGASTVVYERNQMAGKKLLIAGKGRCNFTNDCSVEKVVEAFGSNGRFLYSAVSMFGPKDMCALMKNLGVGYKVERGRRVFPVSDRASDVRDALLAFALSAGAHVTTGTRITSLVLQSGAVAGVRDASGHVHSADAVIVATGGASYPATGSTGDGYRLAQSAGHSVIPPLPALVPIETVEEWPKALAGLTLRNVELSLSDQGRLVGQEFGEMLFTHFGVSGPIVLTLSRQVCTSLRSSPILTPGRFRLSIDLKPALDEPTLARRIQRDLVRGSRKHLGNSFGELLPRALIPVVIAHSEVDPATPANQVTREQRDALVRTLKSLPLSVARTRPLDEAIVTSGGVDLDEVDPRTMESRLVRGLFFAGEVLDLDAVTGGYNLQAAFSTGRLAGLSAARGARR
jgi:predicted Rossmann fold flavoprotein